MVGPAGTMVREPIKGMDLLVRPYYCWLRATLTYDLHSDCISITEELSRWRDVQGHLTSVGVVSWLGDGKCQGADTRGTKLSAVGEGL